VKISFFPLLRVLSHTQSQASFRISFEVKDLKPLRQQAIAEAVKNSREKAQVLTEAAGVELGEIMQIDYIYFRGIRPRSKFWKAGFAFRPGRFCV